MYDGITAKIHQLREDSMTHIVEDHNFVAYANDCDKAKELCEQITDLRHSQLTPLDLTLFAVELLHTAYRDLVVSDTDECPLDNDERDLRDLTGETYYDLMYHLEELRNPIDLYGRIHSVGWALKI